MKKKCACLLISLVMVFSTTVLISGCDTKGLGNQLKADAVVRVMPTKGNSANGVVIFTKVINGVRIVADLKDLSPGTHGIHIHEFGDCRAENGSSAGDHFNPDSKAHGAPDAEERHAGDLGNIVADENGMAKLDIVDKVIALDGESGIIGRSVVVHAGEDDFKTQPHGNAGDRVACGAIGLAR